MLLRFIALLLISSVAWAGPQTVNFKKDWLHTSLTNEFIYNSWKNTSPPFGTYQMHEGLEEFFDSNGESQLCFPSAMTTAMVKQFAFQDKPLTALKLQGLSPDQASIDLNEAVRDFMTRCKTDTEYGTYANEGANCIYDFYKESGVNHFEVKLIRTYRSEIETPNVPNVIKKIEISDITTALDQGFDVIGFVQWANPDTQERRWKNEGGHFVNIFGYARQVPWVDQIILYINNPMRLFDNKMSFQAFDPVFAQKVPLDRGLSVSSSMGEIVLDGFGFVGNKYRGFLSGLLIFKAE